MRAMIYLGSWSSLSEAARYLRSKTGEVWTETAIISRLIEIGIDTICVSVAEDVPLTQPYNKEQQEAVPYGYAQLMQVCGVPQFLHELEIAGRARPLGLINEGGTRYKTTTPIPSSAVRLSRHQIDQLQTAFHCLVAEVAGGKYGNLKTIIEGEAPVGSGEPTPASHLEAAAPPVAKGQDEFGKQSNKTTHRTKSRRHVLTAIIELASEQATTPDDYHSVWATLVRLAEHSTRPAPLLGYAEEEGIKYQTDKGIEFFTKGALRSRMNRKRRQCKFMFDSVR